jgi:hypothetical protein
MVEQTVTRDRWETSERYLPLTAPVSISRGPTCVISTGQLRVRLSTMSTPE